MAMSRASQLLSVADSARYGSINVVVFRNFEAFARERGRFNDLLENSNSIYPFCTFEWLESWWEAFGTESKLLFIVATEPHSGQWLGVLPLSITRYGPTDLWIKMVEPIASRYSDYSVPIVRRCRVRETLEMLLSCALARLPEACVLNLRHWPIEHESYSVLTHYLDKHRIQYSVVKHVCPVLYLKQSSGKRQAGCNKKHLSDVKRQTRRLQNLGDLRLRVLSDADNLVPHLGNLFKMHIGQWREKGFVSDFQRLRAREFYRAIVNKMSHKGLHFSALVLNGRPISYHLGFVRNGYFYYYKPAFDTRYSQYSPGKVHVNYLIEEACNQNWAIFDFLKGDEPYKFLWTKDTRETASVLIFPSTRSLRVQWVMSTKAKVYSCLGKYYRKAKIVFQDGTARRAVSGEA